jgi:hypothetical protein
MKLQIFLQFAFLHPTLTRDIQSTCRIDRITELVERGHGPFPDASICKQYMTYFLEYL